MWGEIVGGFKWLIKLARDAEHDRAEREKLRRQLDDPTKAVEWLWAREEQRSRDEEHHRREEAHERENLVLRLKVQLLEFERRLTPPVPGVPASSRLDPD